MMDWLENAFMFMYLAFMGLLMVALFFSLLFIVALPFLLIFGVIDGG